MVKSKGGSIRRHLYAFSAAKVRFLNIYCKVNRLDLVFVNFAEAYI